MLVWPILTKPVLNNTIGDLTMAQPRTFQFYGVAYGNSPVTITASINSTQVFSGQVPTVSGPFPPNTYPAANAQSVLFTIDNSANLNTDFAGSLPMTLAVSGGDGVIVQNIYCNYYQNPTIPPGASATDFGSSYYGTPTNSEGTSDSRSSVVINGVAQPAPTRQSGETGNWPWEVPTGQPMGYNWNISLGEVANVANTSQGLPGNISTYSGDYTAFLKS